MYQYVFGEGDGVEAPDDVSGSLAAHSLLIPYTPMHVKPLAYSNQIFALPADTDAEPQGLLPKTRNAKHH